MVLDQNQYQKQNVHEALALNQVLDYLFPLPKIKSNNSKAERAVLIKTSEKRKGTNNEYFNTSPYGRVANMI